MRGFFYPYRGLRFLLRHPRLLGFVAVPVAVNTLLYGAFLWFVRSRFGGWIEHWVPRGDAWYWAVLFYAAATVTAAVLLLVVVYTFTLAGNLLLAPFNGFLSERVEALYAGSGPGEPFRLAALLKDASRSVKAELGRLALYASGFALLLLLHLVPPPLGQLAYGAGLGLFTLFFLGWEYLDYSMERWQFGFGQKRRAALGNAATFVGFGAGAGLLLLIPLLNLLAIPVCVTGATLLFADLRRGGRLPAPSGAPARGAAP